MAGYMERINCSPNAMEEFDSCPSTEYTETKYC